VDETRTLIDSPHRIPHRQCNTFRWERAANYAATEGATAPETLRSTDHMKDKMLESGLLVKGPADGVNLSGPTGQQAARKTASPYSVYG